MAACATVTTEQVTVEELVVTDGSSETVFTVDDMQGLSETQADLQGETYVGVPLPVLLEAAGFNPANLSSARAVATDGYTVTYNAEIFTNAVMLVAYATASGSLAEDDGTFRMVLPGEAGKRNVRMLSELQVETK